MKISKNLTVSAKPEEVTAALLSEELATKRMEKLGVTTFTHTTSGETATTKVLIPAQRLPSQARTFLKSDVSVEIDTLAAGETVSYQIDVKGAPVKIAVAVYLKAAGTETWITIDADLQVKVPFIGAKVEKMAAGKVDLLLAKDAELIQQTISNARS